jgi:hypothetical protein
MRGLLTKNFEQTGCAKICSAMKGSDTIITAVSQKYLVKIHSIVLNITYKVFLSR